MLHNVWSVGVIVLVCLKDFLPEGSEQSVFVSVSERFVSFVIQKCLGSKYLIARLSGILPQCRGFFTCVGRRSCVPSM